MAVRSCWDEIDAIAQEAIWYDGDATDELGGPGWL